MQNTRERPKDSGEPRRPETRAHIGTLFRMTFQARQRQLFWPEARLGVLERSVGASGVLVVVFLVLVAGSMGVECCDPLTQFLVLY